jgi:hypothetical protein
MRGQRFDAEGFGRIMAAENQIHAEFFRRDRRPVWRFAGDESVDSFLGHAVNFRARSSCDDSDVAHLFDGAGLFFLYLIAVMIHVWGIEDRAVPTKEDEGEQY